MSTSRGSLASTSAGLYTMRVMPPPAGQVVGWELAVDAAAERLYSVFPTVAVAGMNESGDSWK